MSETADIAARRPRGGRPTRAAAAERDERLLDIATAMFLEQGFDATSMDGLAEAAAIGKATLYARYADKGALFAEVLRRRILQVYAPLEAEFAAPAPGADLAQMLHRVAARLMAKTLSAEAVTLGRILSAQGQRFPELVQLAVREGYGRRLRLIETILPPFATDSRYRLDDLPLAADLFLSLVLGHAMRLAVFGIQLAPEQQERRTERAIAMFIRGIAAQA